MSMGHQFERSSHDSASTPDTAKGRLPKVQKIAVLRATALGDFLLTLPALVALNKTYPQAEIVLLGLSWHARFLKDRPSPIKRVIVIPPYGGVGMDPGYQADESELTAFFAEMQREYFDLALQLHGGGRYPNVFLNRLGARTTAGVRTPDAPQLDRWIPYIYFQHKVLRFQETVGLVGAHQGHTEIGNEPRLTVTAADLEAAEAVIPTTPQPLVVIHPGASDPRRRWSPRNFAAIGDMLAEQGAKILVTGSNSERALVSEVVHTMHAPAYDLSGQLSINALTGLLARCRLVVANNTGPRHLANAVGTPTVSIYWCINLLNAGPLTRQYHRPHVSWRLECPTCGKHCLPDTCSHTTSLVDDVTIDEVSKSAYDLYYTQ